MASSNVLRTWVGGDAGSPCPCGRFMPMAMAMPAAASMRRRGLPNAVRPPLPLLEPYP